MLIAKDAREDRLYAVERVQRHKYALCRLGSWVKISDLVARAALAVTECEPKRKRQALGWDKSQQPWWARAEVDTAGVPRIQNPDVTQPRLCMRFSSDDLVNVHSAPPTTIVQPAEILESHESQFESQGDNSFALGVVNAQDALEELSKQYLETLYLSRTSLAYFSKGPLARARAALSCNSSSELQAAELIAFLRQATLSSATMEKKYRESVTQLINDLPTIEPESAGKAVKARRKSKWKPKRDRSGLFTNEKDYLALWWRKEDENDSSSSSMETTETLLKQRAPRLRKRETFLQIILILEILALEALSPPTNPTLDTENKTAVVNSKNSQADNGEKKQKKKKEADIAGILDGLVDWLCIWCSLESSSPVKSDNLGNNSGKEDGNDELKSFCVEVIIPFYMSRCPQQAASVNKKLGGPSAPTPVKRRPSAISKKPGEPAGRQPPEPRTRELMTRVSTETLNQPTGRPSSLQRSATDSDLLAANIKKENGDVSVVLGDIAPARLKPQQSMQALPRKRVSLLHQIPGSKREVDLSAMSQSNQVKLRKKAEVNEKLRDAIATLKKPNRALAVQEIAENADERFAKAITKGKSTSNSQAKRGVGERSKPIAVTATPKHVKATPVRRTNSTKTSMQSSGSYPTSIVPSSGVKLFAHSLNVSSRTPAVPQTGHRARHALDVEDTPSRGFAKFLPTALAREPGTLLESPIGDRKRSTVQPLTQPLKMRALNETTIAKPSSDTVGLSKYDSKQRVTFDTKEASPTRRGTRHAADSPLGKYIGPQPQSIYDTLGWNEDYEELG